MAFIGNLEIAELWKTLRTKEDAREILRNFLPLVYKMDSRKLDGRKQDPISTSFVALNLMLFEDMKRTIKETEFTRSLGSPKEGNVTECCKKLNLRGFVLSIPVGEDC